MNIHELLCKEFCGALSVRPVPVGFAIGTGYDGPSGDPIGFYVVGPDSNGKFRIEDDGISISMIESQGSDLSSKTRSEAFNSLLQEYGVLFDDKSGELITGSISEGQVAAAALRFVAFLLRVQDLVLMSQERVASTFKDDATKILMEQLQGRAEIKSEHAIHPDLKEYPADIAIYALDNQDRAPVALFFGSSDARVYEALLLQSYADNKRIPCSVVALIESQGSLSHKVQQRASNHLDAVPVFRGDEQDACARIVKEALGSGATWH